MKKIYLIAATATMLAACTSNDKLEVSPDPVQPKLEAGAVGFDAYTNRSVTRSGFIGDMTMDNLKNTKALKGGFGVFGYYTDNKEYDQQATPNFFWNQGVFWKGADGTGAESWLYSPVKYWPNEYGSTAVSEDYDKVSFFAYAPYVEVDENSGKVTDANENTWGITQVTRNTASGDPIVKYIASFDPTKAVDLMWGVCDNPNWPIVLNGQDQNLNNGQKGLPWIDVQRPSQVDQLMKFSFKHALAKLNVQVDYVADAYVNANSADIAEAETRIWIRSIRFNGIAMKGALNLNNTEVGADKPYWMNYNGVGELEADADITICDGRKDGKEGVVGAAAGNEKVLGLNPKVIQNPDADDAANQPKTATNATGTIGVTKAAKNMFNSATADGCIYVIPTEEEMVVEIVYDVETVDPNLATLLADGVTHGSSIENRISKAIKFAPKAGSITPVTSLQPGNAYQLKLHLGMNSVKLDAEVLDWEELKPGTEANLPANMPEIAVGSTNYAVNVAADATTYTFALSGLQVGESLSVGTPLPANVTNVSIAPAATQTWELVTVTLAPNATVSDVLNTITITGTKSGATSVDITQKAHALALSATALDGANKKITLAAGGTVDPWPTSSTTTDPAYVTITRSGVALAYNATPAADTDFSIDANTGEITLFKDFEIGETYIITVKVGNAPAETISFQIGGLLLNATASVAEGGTVTLTPTIIGTGNITNWQSSSDANATVADGVVTGVAAGSANIKATLTPTLTDGTDGFLYLSATPEATCAVTVTAAP